MAACAGIVFATTAAPGAFADPSETPTPTATPVASAPAASPTITTTAAPDPRAPGQANVAPKPPNATGSPLGPMPSPPAGTRQLDARLCQGFPPSGDGSFPREAWHLTRLDMPSAWERATGRGVTVAVIDTGVDPHASMYLGTQRVSTYDFVPPDNDGNQDGYDCAHGTRVTSLIAGSRFVDRRITFSGIAPDARIIAFRALKGTGQTESFEPTIEAIKAATATPGVDIINISQAGSYGTPAYAAAIQAAIDKGIVVVASTGNADQRLVGPAYPAAYPGVIAVGMTGPDDAPDPRSYTHPQMEITIGAPGVDLVALNPPEKINSSDPNVIVTNQPYATGLVGTSYAAPIVSGVVALMLEANPNLTPAEVKARLQATADPPAASVPDRSIGYGIVNPVRALTGVAVEVPDGSVPTVINTHTPYPAPPQADPRPRAIALLLAAITTVLVVGGLLIRFAVPAMRNRNFAPATPHEPVDETDDLDEDDDTDDFLTVGGA